MPVIIARFTIKLRAEIGLKDPVKDPWIFRVYLFHRAQHAPNIYKHARPTFVLEQGEECLRLPLAKNPVGHDEDDCIILGFVGFIGFLVLGVRF